MMLRRVTIIEMAPHLNGCVMLKCWLSKTNRDEKCCKILCCDMNSGSPAKTGTWTIEKRNCYNFKITLK